MPNPARLPSRRPRSRPRANPLAASGPDKEKAARTRSPGSLFFSLGSETYRVTARPPSHPAPQPAEWRPRPPTSTYPCVFYLKRRSGLTMRGDGEGCMRGDKPRPVTPGQTASQLGNLPVSPRWPLTPTLQLQFKSLCKHQKRNFGRRNRESPTPHIPLRALPERHVKCPDF